MGEKAQHEQRQGTSVSRMLTLPGVNVRKMVLEVSIVWMTGETAPKARAR